MADKVLFYVQHLLGIGHVVRSSRIARALEREGFAVTIAYGGVPLAGADWGSADVVQLPAVSAGPEGFGSLVTADGEPVSESFKDQRKDQLLALFSTLRPDILLVEAYPFARRIMRFELLPLLRTAGNSVPRPLIVSSIRDILQEGRKPKRIIETRELVEQFFDAVLVHGEEEFVPLAVSFPEAGLIADKLHYTGWVGPEPGEPQGDEKFEVIVSAGGGAVGAALFEAALSVSAGGAFADGKWLVLTGPNLAEDTFLSLSRKLPSFVTLERFRADLPALLRNAQVSVSQSGYNTVADILSAGCRAVFVPYAQDGETEQLRRAETLAAQGRVVVVQQAELSAETLTAALDEALKLPQPEPSRLMNGAAATASILRALRRPAKE
ncbi:MAG: glycosyl transferase [Rhizobiales bacterium]|nr:glycosyl transferase [Hyphomicrobiales bacterium]